MHILQKNENIQGIRKTPVWKMPRILCESNTGMEAAGPHFVISREFSNMPVV